MKKIAFLLLFFFAIVSLHAQDYMINFIGIGASTTVDAVTVENFTQGKSISLLGSETLHLMATVTGNAIELNNVDFPLHIYPNPSSDFFTLEFSAKSGPVSITLFDRSGREMANLKQPLSNGIHSFRVSRLNYGIYTIKVDLQNQSYSGKLISQGSSNTQITINYLGNKGAAQENIKLKNATTERFWQYTTGDILGFTGSFGDLSTVIMDVPTKSKTLTFSFTASLPTVTTTAATNITSTGATLGGNVISDGNATVTERGICYSTSESPTTSSSKVVIGGGTGSFSSTITGLSPNTTYYVRAYAINSKDTGYGEPFIFTTKSISTPEVTTSTVTEILPTSAVSGGNVTNDGNLEVTARGVCWKLAGQNPTINDSKSTDGTGVGSFTSILTGLQPNADYYIRAYATNSQGTSYGEEIFFATTQVLSLATVITSAATLVTSSSAVLGGNVTSDGNATVTERGICYSTSESPTASNIKVVIGTGTGSFSSTITGLSANTTYYVRTYAINSQGPFYGNELNFKTESEIVTDIDGNIYHTETIGTQVWMVENLKATKYNDGQSIRNVTDALAWEGLTDGAYCWYNNNRDYYNLYGALYNWHTVNTGKLAPKGWHVPSDTEWTTLANFLGGESIAGGKLKETGMAHWESPNTGASNSNGFTALPGGNRNYAGIYSSMGDYGWWWSSTETNSDDASIRYIYFDYLSLDSSARNKGVGFSVRCIKD
ncbi:MAG TPA: FISUMP domain-containing protein [Prolixibacteraceae bacterium]|jgi:uncharacterized protein (TIGR02145 family)